MKTVLAYALTLTVLMSAAAHAWTDQTYNQKGTPLRAQPSGKGKVIATIPDNETVRGATKSIDRDCSYEDKYDTFCKMVWRGKTGYILIDDLLDLGDFDF